MASNVGTSKRVIRDPRGGIQHPKQADPPVVQPCCGKAHYLPAQHVIFYKDKRGRTKHWYECAICFRTRHLEGRLTPRYPKRPGDAHCDECAAELIQRIDAAEDDGFDLFARVARNNER